MTEQRSRTPQYHLGVQRRAPQDPASQTPHRGSTSQPLRPPPQFVISTSEGRRIRVRSENEDLCLRPHRHHQLGCSLQPGWRLSQTFSRAKFKRDTERSSSMSIHYPGGQLISAPGPPLQKTSPSHRLLIYGCKKAIDPQGPASRTPQRGSKSRPTIVSIFQVTAPCCPISALGADHQGDVPVHQVRRKQEGQPL